MDFKIIIKDDENEKLVREVYDNKIISAYITLKQGIPEKGDKIKFKLNDLYALAGFCSPFLISFKSNTGYKGNGGYKLKSSKEKSRERDFNEMKGQALFVLGIIFKILNQNLDNRKVVFEVL
jgi:hypothetical protein